MGQFAASRLYESLRKDVFSDILRQGPDIESVLCNMIYRYTHSAAANEKSWVAHWTAHLVPWLVRNNFGLSNTQILKPKLYILITKNSDMDFGKRNSRFASRTCSWEYLGRPTVLWVAFWRPGDHLAAALMHWMPRASVSAPWYL